MKISTSSFVFLSCMAVLTPLYAATQQLSTYYPAPQGNYKNMKVNDAVELTSQTSPCSATGSNINLTNVNGVLEICSQSGSFSLTTNSSWASVSNSDGTYSMYPASLGQNPPVNQNIGIGTTNPQANLDVNGTIKGQPVCRIVTNQGPAPSYTSVALCTSTEWLLTGGGTVTNPSVSQGFLHTSEPHITNGVADGWIIDGFGYNWTHDVPTTAYAVCCEKGTSS